MHDLSLIYASAELIEPRPLSVYRLERRLARVNAWLVLALIAVSGWFAGIVTAALAWGLL